MSNEFKNCVARIAEGFAGGLLLHILSGLGATTATGAWHLVGHLLGMVACNVVGGR